MLRSSVDLQGDSLPEGALARMGTLRWRHGNSVAFVGFTPDGKGILTASMDKVVRLWDRETGNEIRRFAAPAPANSTAPGMDNFSRFHIGVGRTAL